MTAWRPAHSLVTLVGQLRPLAPNAPPGSFGFIGDAAHAARKSDHNPVNFPGWGDAIVTATDFPNREQLDAHAVLDAIRASRDSRVKYGISRGQMFSSYASSGYPPFTWRPYSGVDGHFSHGHLSVVGDQRADDVRPWSIGGDMSADVDDIIRRWSGGVPAKADGSELSPVAWRIRDEAWQRSVDGMLVKLTTQIANLTAPAAGLTDAQVADLGERIAAVLDARLEALLKTAAKTGAELAIRTVLGSLDDQPPGAV